MQIKPHQRERKHVRVTEKKNIKKKNCGGKQLNLKGEALIMCTYHVIAW